MEKFIEKIQTLRETIAELQKCDDLTEEQIEKLDKAVVSLKDYKAKKKKKQDTAGKQKLKEMGSNIQRQIDTAMREGVPEEGNFETDKKKRPDLKLVKALEEAGFRESALLLKNWGEMDDMAKVMEEEMEKGMLFPKEDKPICEAKPEDRKKEDFARDIKYAIERLKELKDIKWTIEEEVPEAKGIMEKEFARLKRDIDEYIKKYSKAKK